MTDTVATPVADACTPIAFAALPALGQPLAGGVFAGITTQPDGTHAAVALLPEQAVDMDWPTALAWAAEQEAQLPSRPVAALLFANLRPQLRKRWHWTNEAHEDDASYAWGCLFYGGTQNSTTTRALRPVLLPSA